MASFIRDSPKPVHSTTFPTRRIRNKMNQNNHISLAWGTQTNTTTQAFRWPWGAKPCAQSLLWAFGLKACRKPRNDSAGCDSGSWVGNSDAQRPRHGMFFGWLRFKGNPSPQKKVGKRGGIHWAAGTRLLQRPAGAVSRRLPHPPSVSREVAN